jgi:DNA mismatch repair protein MutS
VIDNARLILTDLEQQPSRQGTDKSAAPQLALFAEPVSKALKLLDSYDPDEMSPKQALEALYRLKKAR